jgi:hypothetical protein
MRLILSAAFFGTLALGELVNAAEPSRGSGRPDASREEPPDAKVVLQQVLLDLLTNPELQSARDFYRAPRDKSIALQIDSPVAWPNGWRPKLPGYKVRYQSAENALLDFIYWHVPWGVEIYSFIRERTPRQLGVRLDTLHLDPRREYDDQICVCLFNLGGDGGEAPVIGGCIVYYNLKRERGKWLVEYAGSFDP